MTMVSDIAQVQPFVAVRTRALRLRGKWKSAKSLKSVCNVAARAGSGRLRYTGAGRDQRHWLA
jgi:hypothetical protein